MLLDVKRTEKWIAALEANGYRQIQFQLVRGHNRCALGIINETENDICSLTDEHWLPSDFHKLGMSLKLGFTIATLNDGVHYVKGSSRPPRTFYEIANLLKIRLRAQQEFLPAIQAKEEQRAVTNTPVSTTA